MPHIVAKNCKRFDTPVKEDEFEFLWFAKPLINARETLVGVLHKNQKFLLTIKQNRAGEIVIKSDKVSRPAPTVLVKKALKSFCNLSECEVIRSNIENLKESHFKKYQKFLKDIEFFSKNFPKTKELWIEIGFGSGRHLLYQAKNNPDIQFVGIEIHKPSIEQVLKQISIQKIENIWVLDYDARLFLELVPSNIVGKIFVHFPVPWDEKPHRRVISEKFISEAKRVLKKDGVLELRTDSKKYFDYSLSLFLNQERAKLEVAKNIESPVSSKYEDRWRRLNKDIYDIRLINDEVSKPKENGFNFEFENEFDVEKIIKNFDLKPKVYEDFFIHFEKIYKINSDSILIKLSFGDFNRPEHKYVLIQNKKASYFGTIPVITSSNIKSHKKIKELLNGQ